jgi:DNA-binding response OmpR family regulator
MNLGFADQLPQERLLLRRVGVLCSETAIAAELSSFLAKELGIRPLVLDHDELASVDVLIVAENAISALVGSVKRVRQRAETMPIMAVTTEDQPTAIECAFSAGADDVITVPNRKTELPLRLMAICRRESGFWTRKSTQISLDLVGSMSAAKVQLVEERAPFSTRCVVTVEGVRIILTSREWAVLRYLVAKPNDWVTAAELLAMVCDCPTKSDSTLVRVHVSAIRKKLGRYGHFIESRRTYGYRWSDRSDEL